jgi:uncharacterized hydrophobic protein (TIGR00271 family)
MNTFEAWSAFVRSLQHRAALALGVAESHRADTVLAMLVNNRRRAPGYWIQLVLAMGIATLGLVLSSTAVVIGAMLVSPLMGPIVEVGMGFAVGSSFLVFRAALRVLMSVVVVVAGAAVLTVLLPFHEVTAEISTRAAPTALDLLVAVFCALTAAYTTVRSTSDTTSAAAGTAIGIALVPPLCATGFGLGTGIPAIAAGAALLFTANLSAIFVFSIAAFLVLGYNQVDAKSVERELGVADGTRADVLAARGQVALERLFGSRYGMAMRLLIPAFFLGAVYVPLRSALNEVTWEVRARDAIRRIVSTEAPRAVQSSIVVERHTIALHLLVVASTERASAMERVIRERVETSTGVRPDLTITAMPDAAALAAATRATSSAPADEPLDPSRVEDRLGTALGAAWPRAASGDLLGWELLLAPKATPLLVTYHLGPELGAGGRALLASSLGGRLAARLEVADSAMVPATATAALGTETRWRVELRRRLDWLGHARSAAACMRGPVSATRRITAPQKAILADIQRSKAALQGRLLMRDSSGWRMTVVLGTCAEAADSAVAGRDTTG